MQLSKSDLSKMLHALGVQVNEGETPASFESTYPRIVYWPYIYEYDNASGSDYLDLRTYQISLFTQTSDDAVFFALRKSFKDIGLTPAIYQERVRENDQKYVHSYFAVQVIEDEQ